MLSLLIDCLNKNEIPDVLIVPTVLTYERVWEINELVSEQLGKSKSSETLWSSIKGAFRLLRSFCGLIRVDFGEPFSLREFVRQSQLMDVQSSTAVVTRNAFSPGINTDVKTTNSAQLLAQHVIFDCCRVSPITLTHTVAFLLLRIYRKGTTVKNLAKRLSELRREIICRGYEVAFFDDGEEDGLVDAVRFALKLIGTECLEAESRDFSMAEYVRPHNDMRSYMTLSYFSARLLIVYAAEAIIATSFVSSTKLSEFKVKDDKNMSSNDLPELADTEYRMDKNVLLQRAEVLGRLLCKEFVLFPPCGSLLNELESALGRLLQSEVLSYRDAPVRPFVNPDVVDPQESDNDDDYSDNDELGMYPGTSEDEHEDDPHVKVSVKNHQHKHPQLPQGPTVELNMMKEKAATHRLLELHSYTLPFLESMWATACNVANFSEQPTLIQKEREFIQLCQKDLIDTLSDGNVTFEESTSLTSLANSVKCLEHFGFLKRCTVDRSMHLCIGKYLVDNSHTDMVEGLIEILEYFRVVPNTDFPSQVSPYYSLIDHILTA